MSLESRVVALLSVSGISALVGSRVYATEAPQDVTAPFVVWQRIATTVEHTHDGDNAGAALIQVAAFATRYTDAAAIRDAVKSAVTAGDASGPVTISDIRDTKESEVNLYRCDLDFEIFQTL